MLFVGQKGMLIADYGQHKLLPESQFAGFKPPARTIPASIGHHAEWILACKKGGPTTCNFDYSGTLAETVLLGNVAYRAGKKLQWDPVALKAVNCPEADNYLRAQYRQSSRERSVRKISVAFRSAKVLRTFARAKGDSTTRIDLPILGKKRGGHDRWPSPN